MWIYTSSKPIVVYKDGPDRIIGEVNVELREKILNGRLTIEENG